MVPLAPMLEAGESATARSSFPSPLKSPTAKLPGVIGPVEMTTGAWKVKVEPCDEYAAQRSNDTQKSMVPILDTIVPGEEQAYSQAHSRKAQEHLKLDNFPGRVGITSRSRSPTPAS